MRGCFFCLFVLLSLINAGRRNTCGLYVPERGSDLCYESVTAVNGLVRWPPEAFQRSFWAWARGGNSTTLASYCSRSSDLTMHCLQSVSEIKWMVLWTLGKTEVWGPVDVHAVWLLRTFLEFFHTSQPHACVCVCMWVKAQLYSKQRQWCCTLQV